MPIEIDGLPFWKMGGSFHGKLLVITRGYPSSCGDPRDPSATRSAERERWRYWTWVRRPGVGSSGWANEHMGVEMGIPSIAGWLIMENSIFRFLRWTFFLPWQAFGSVFSRDSFRMNWASTSAVIYAARQASMNLINHEGVQDGNFMRMCNQTDCFRELRGCFWVPWLWLWKINLQQRAPISANERELKRCAF